jgi:hypothetical protein
MKFMKNLSEKEQEIFTKIHQLSFSQMIEVEKFIDLLQQGYDDRKTSLAATKLSEQAFAQAWDNSDDAIYDNL